MTARIGQKENAVDFIKTNRRIQMEPPKAIKTIDVNQIRSKQLNSQDKNFFTDRGFSKQTATQMARLVSIKNNPPKNK